METGVETGKSFWTLRPSRWVAAFFLVLIVAHTVWPLVTAHGIREELAAIREAGEPVTFEDLARARVKIDPQDDAGPIYEEAVSHLYGVSGEGRAGYLVQQYKLHTTQWPLKVPTDGTQQDVEKLLKRNAQALELIDQAARLPECSYDMQVRQGTEAFLDNIGGPRNLASLAILRAVYRAFRREGDAAADALIAALRIPRILERDTNMVLSQVAAALRGSAYTSLPIILETDPSDEKLQRLEQILSEADRPEIAYE